MKQWDVQEFLNPDFVGEIFLLDLGNIPSLSEKAWRGVQYQFSCPQNCGQIHAFPKVA
jgi:hypothetical protein